MTSIAFEKKQMDDPIHREVTLYPGIAEYDEQVYRRPEFGVGVQERALALNARILPSAVNSSLSKSSLKNLLYGSFWAIGSLAIFRGLFSSEDDSAAVRVIAVALLAFGLLQVLYSKRKHHTACSKNHLAPSTHQLKYRDRFPEVRSSYNWQKVDHVWIPRNTEATAELGFRLIEQAQQEILICNGIGGRTFEKVIDALFQRMALVKALRVFFQTPDVYVKEKNRESLAQLKGAFPNRVFVVQSQRGVEQRAPYPGGVTLEIGNHIKFFIVDRQVMLLGGSVMDDRWGEIEVREFGKKNWFDPFLARKFQDRDIMIHSSDHHSVIHGTALEFFRLASRWEHYNRVFSRKETAEKDRLHDFYQPLGSSPLIDVSNVKMDGLVIGCGSAPVKYMISSPEHRENLFAKELQSLFAKAQKRIILSHMYVHPTSPLLKALKGALNRGVPVMIFTNQEQAAAPKSHKVFAPRSMFQIRQISGFKKELKLTVHLWNKPNSTLHSKVIIVDDSLIVGSHNFSRKGLDTMADYEYSLRVDSERASEAMLEICQKDLKRECFDILSPEQVGRWPGLTETFKALAHYLVDHKIG